MLYFIYYELFSVKFNFVYADMERFLLDMFTFSLSFIATLSSSSCVVYHKICILKLCVILHMISATSSLNFKHL